MKWNEMVKDLMDKQGINQKQLSEMSGITGSSISRYLKSGKSPRMDIIVNVAKALQVETSYFLGESDRCQDAYTAISTAIARNGNELSPEEKNRLIELLLRGSRV